MGRRRRIDTLSRKAITVFALAYVTSPVLVAALILYGIIGRTVSTVISWLVIILRKKPAALGLLWGVNLVGMSSAVIAPLISGLVKDMTGSLSGAFYLGALIVLVGMICTAITPEI